MKVESKKFYVYREDEETHETHKIHAATVKFYKKRTVVEWVSSEEFKLCIRKFYKVTGIYDANHVIPQGISFNQTGYLR